MSDFAGRSGLEYNGRPLITRMPLFAGLDMMTLRVMLMRHLSPTFRGNANVILCCASRYSVLAILLCDL